MVVQKFKIGDLIVDITDDPKWKGMVLEVTGYMRHLVQGEVVKSVHPDFPEGYYNKSSGWNQDDFELVESGISKEQEVW